MRWSRIIGGFLGLVLICGCGWAGTDSSLVLTLPQYIAELDRISTGLSGVEQHPQRAAELLDRVPESWTVTTPEGHSYTVPAAWLKSELLQHKPGAYRAIRARLMVLSREAKGYSNNFFEPQRERAKLADILARREFHDVHGPSWLQRLQERLHELFTVIATAIWLLCIPHRQPYPGLAVDRDGFGSAGLVHLPVGKAACGAGHYSPGGFARFRKIMVNLGRGGARGRDARRLARRCPSRLLGWNFLSGNAGLVEARSCPNAP